MLLDGDNVRHGLNRDLGFTDADRVENIRRVAEVAQADGRRRADRAGLLHLAVPRRAGDGARPGAEGEFFEIFVDTPLEVAEERDAKGLYKKARAGELKNFTGIDSPYEAAGNAGNPHRHDARQRGRCGGVDRGAANRRWRGWVERLAHTRPRSISSMTEKSLPP